MNRGMQTVATVSRGYRPARWSILLAIVIVALAATDGGRGMLHVWSAPAAAQRPISAEDEEWIQRAVARADVDSDADRLELAGCLRARISTGTGRFEAIAVCYAQFQEARTTAEELAARLVPELGARAAAEIGAPALSYEETLKERQRLIDVRTAQLLEALRLWGATPEQLAALRGPLSACMAAWGTVAPLEIIRNDAGEPAYSLSESVVEWCAGDLPDFNQLRRKQPTIQSLGCPDPALQDRPFTCDPRIEGDASIFAWKVSGGTSAEGRNASLTARTAGMAAISLLICNGEPDPGTAGNCTSMDQSLTVEPRPPVVGAPGCPASVALNQPVVCTPTGVSDTGSTTTWGWTATGGQLANDGQPTATVTFTAGGVQTVTVIACNSARSCSAPVSQGVMVGPAQAATAASIRVDKGSYRADETMTYCFTVPGPGPVRFTMTFSGSQARLLFEGIDDGRGDCLTDRVTLPPGMPPASGCVVMQYNAGGRSASEQACFGIVAPAASPSPSPSSSAAGSSFDVGGIYRGSFPDSSKGFPLITLQRFQIDVVRGMSDANIRATSLTRNTIQVTLRSNGTVLDAMVELDVSRMDQSSRLTGTYRGRLAPDSPVVIEGASGPPSLIFGTFRVSGAVQTFVNGMANRSANEGLVFYYVMDLTNGSPNGRLILCEDRSRDRCRGNPIATLRP